MRKILFQNTEHTDTHATAVTPSGETTAMYSTVRRGLKWACLSVGEEIELADSHGAVVYHAVVADVRVLRFCDLALHPGLVLTNHDKDCRRCPTLLRRMETVYPGFVSEEIVTVVAYTLL